MGIMSAVSMFVTMFLSPFTGSIIDKCNRKWVMVGVDLLQGALMITVGTLAFAEKLNVPIVLIAAFLAAFGSVFYSPASSTLMLDIIPRGDMVRGQSIFSGSTSFVNLIGTAFSGVMIALLGVPLIIIINGISNFYSAVSELFVTVPKTVQQGDPVSVKSVLKDSKKAVRVILSEPCLKLFVPFALILNLLAAGPVSLALPFCMEKGLSVDMYGYVMAGWTVAYLICTVILGSVKFKPKARFWIMAVGFSSQAIFMSLAFVSHSFLTIFIFSFIGAFMNCAGNTVFNAALMLALPEENRGAVLGFIQSACVGGTALSAVIYGALGDIFPLYIVFTAGTLISLVPMMYLCFNPKTKSFILTH